MDRVICKTPAAKRILADHLKEHDTEMLDMFQALSGEFGPAEQVSYEGRQQDNLVAELTAMRDKEQAESMKTIGENT